jgi:excisionase family DNA binding protein
MESWLVGRAERLCRGLASAGRVVYYNNMITVPEAARRVRRDPETIRRWIRSGRLASQRIGTQHLVDERELEALVYREELPSPPGWSRTATGEPMPSVLDALDRSRAGR